MNYFSKISEGCDKLTEIGQTYLDSLPFIPSGEAAERIWNKARSIFDSLGGDEKAWEDENLPQWVADTMDWAVPYTQIPRNGSLHYSLGWSVVAQEANLRALLEYVEGREPEQRKFQMLADLPG